MSDERKSLVLWSGGMDSTLLLWDLLKEKPAGSVRALTIMHDQVPAESEQQRARRLVRAWMKRKGKKFKHSELVIRLQPDFDFCATCGNVSIQSMLWIPPGVTFLEDDEDLYAAYIRHDDIWHYVEKAQAAFSALMLAAGKAGNLVLPLEWDSKQEIITRLRKTRGLLSRTFSCEAPVKGKPCGKCTPCFSIRTARMQLRLGIE